MKNFLTCLMLAMFAHSIPGSSQQFLIDAPAEKRLQVLWQYCTDQLISDKDSVEIHRFFTTVANTADSLEDVSLKAYAQYFRMCYRVPFSSNHEKHFAAGDYHSPIALFRKAQQWAVKNRHPDIAASCEYFIGQIYFRAARYGHAFEHLLKADKAFKDIGYHKVPAASIYLYNIGGDYYRFEEYEKALDCFISALRYPTYVPRLELNTLNAVGLIYARFRDWTNAAKYYRQGIRKAIAYADNAWQGIGAGNLGNVFLSKREYDSALLYHRINYNLNTVEVPEDVAKSALSIATIFIRKQQPDSTIHYINSAQQLAARFYNTAISDGTERLKFRKRFLVVMMEYYKTKGDYRNALMYSDSITSVTDTLNSVLDDKLLSRAIEKVSLEGYQTKLQLLESNKRVSNLKLYLLIAVLLWIIVITALLFRRYRTRKNHQMHVAEQEKKELKLEKIKAEEDLRNAEVRLQEYLETMKVNSTLIENLDSELSQLKQTTSAIAHTAVTENLEKLVSSTILTDEDWRHFRNLFEQVHPQFIPQLKDRFPDLSPGETRLLILTKLKISTREMATMLGITVDAIRKARYRLRKRLNFDKESSFVTAIEEQDF
ncbi:tetratricopeptide repeat protein [Segetibacter sp. 3557_3]|uniref:tetratricopeptide repeat protein n=1 Tax=Segetibacter sp. 3557_3 TaxID=2547429 RepID=UPI001404E62B|nr:tetratricopeptide repeat protein [Segetibacter sp. 3557_3]